MLRLVKSETRPVRPLAGHPPKAHRASAGPIDRSGLCRGNPAEVFEALEPVLGELNFNSYNLKIGVTDQPQQVLADMPCAQCWNSIKLLWTTRSPGQANRMAHLLHAWDAKLYFDGPFPPAGEQPEQPEHAAGPYYAFAAVRNAC